MKRKIALFLAILMTCLIFLPACDKGGEGDDKTPKASDTIAVCVGPDPATLDPALNSAADGATLIIHAFEGLMTLDKDGVPIYGQAKSHTLSEDKKVYTFTLKDDLKWSDGQPLKASDFVYAWNRAIAKETAADYEYMFDVIDGYDAANLM